MFLYFYFGHLKVNNWKNCPFPAHYVTKLLGTPAKHAETLMSDGNAAMVTQLART
jgi:hypothetical protein